MKARKLIIGLLSIFLLFSLAKADIKDLVDLSEEEIEELEGKLEVRETDRPYKDGKGNFYLIGQDGYPRIIFTENEKTDEDYVWSVEARLVDLKAEGMIPEDYFPDESETYDDGSYIQARLFKDLGGGLKNFYDSIGISFFKGTGEINQLVRIQDLVLEKDEIQAKVSEDEAKKIAQDYIESKKIALNIQKISLEIGSTESVKEEYLENIPSYIKDKYYLEYVVEFDDESLLSIDGMTGDVLFYQSTQPGMDEKGDLSYFIGDDRFQTAVKISNWFYIEGAGKAYLVDNNSLEISLRSYLLDSSKAPILIFDKAGLGQEALAELARLNPKTINIVSQDKEARKIVEGQLKDAGIQSELVYTEEDEKSGNYEKPILVKKDSYPDILSSANLIGNGYGAFFVAAGKQPGLSELREGIILGGGLKAPDNKLDRLIGANRYETNKLSLEKSGKDFKTYILVKGDSLVDGLIGLSLVDDETGLVLVGPGGLDENLKSRLELAENIIVIGGGLRLE